MHTVTAAQPANTTRNNNNKKSLWNRYLQCLQYSHFILKLHFVVILYLWLLSRHKIHCLNVCCYHYVVLYAWNLMHTLMFRSSRLCFSEAITKGKQKETEIELKSFPISVSFTCSYSLFVLLSFSIDLIPIPPRSNSNSSISSGIRLNIILKQINGNEWLKKKRGKEHVTSVRSDKSKFLVFSHFKFIKLFILWLKREKKRNWKMVNFKVWLFFLIFQFLQFRKLKHKKRCIASSSSLTPDEAHEWLQE